MSLYPPKLDDRSFHELVAEAKQIVRERCPEWTDLSPGDPGTTLLEVYAFLTEVMLYRINRLPEKAHIEFLRLMGVRLAPPGAARVKLEFRRKQGADDRVVIPRGTRVTIAREGQDEQPPLFTTADTVSLDAGRQTAAVVAHHGDLVQAEDLGISNGLPGQNFQLRQAPVIAPTGDDLDLVIAVEARESELDERVPSLSHDGTSFRIWREVRHFSEIDDEPHAYIADRSLGLVIFAPAVRSANYGTEKGLQPNAEALAAIPPARRRIVAWYRRGGGPAGNVAANTLTVLKDPIAGVKVNNPQAATGGCEAESVKNALKRGPQHLHSLNRAVTARDYEAVALREGSVGLAHAITLAERWRYATPGTVQLMLVPDPSRAGASPDNLATHDHATLENAQTDAALNQVRKAIEERRPLGTHCLVDWYRYKSVRVHARLVLYAEEDSDAVRERILKRLGLMINPLDDRSRRRLLHVSDIYHTVLGEPGVLYADQVHFSVEHAPDRDVDAIAADPHHSGLWYAASGDGIFRSMDNGGGWELLERYAKERIVSLICSEQCPGLVVAISHAETSDHRVSRVRISRDCGHHWQAAHELGFEVNDAAWMLRGGEAVLLLATDKGLYQVPPKSGPIPVLVDDADQDLGFFAVTVAAAPRLGTRVAVAGRGTRGIFICKDERLEDFVHIGLNERDTRVLATQKIGTRVFLWAGLAAVGGEEGEGCLRLELRQDIESSDGWTPVSEGWRGGSCRALASCAEHVFAATFHSGLAVIDSSDRKPAWRLPAIDCGLPLRDEERLLHRINDVAVAPDHDGPLKVLCASPFGVFIDENNALRFTNGSLREFSERVTIGEGFLFCSDTHAIEAVNNATA